MLPILYHLHTQKETTENADYSINFDMIISAIKQFKYLFSCFRY